MAAVAGGSGPGLDRRYRHGQLAVLCVSAVTASPPPPPRRQCAAAGGAALCTTALPGAKQYSMLLTDLPAVTISGFEASHNGRNIWVKI